MAFARHFTAIAIDACGLGRSTPLSTSSPEVADQAIALAEFLDELKIKAVGLYGSHTGASICLEFARMFPERSAIALLEGLPIYSDLERDLRTSTYFPEYTATWEGLHLMWLWYRYREQNVFWPWNIRGKGTRGNVDIPHPRRLHDGLVDILEVGMGYVPPYEGVFRHRAENAIPHLRTPVRFLAYPDDSLLPALRHLPPLPACCGIEHMPIDRAAGVERELELLRSVEICEDAKPSFVTTALPNNSMRAYVDVGGGQLALRRFGIGKGRPLVVLPPAPGSVTMLDTLPELMAKHREVISIDLPGCGDSDVLAGDPPSVQLFASAIEACIRSLGFGRVDVYARDGGACVAAELVRTSPSLVRKVLLDNPACIRPSDRDHIALRYAEPIELDWAGSYLVRLWHATRDQELYWPWFNRTREAVRQNEPDIDPKRLTIEVHSYLKNYETFADTWKAILSYPLFEAMRDGDPSLLVCGDRNSKFSEFFREASNECHEMPIGNLARCEALLALLGE